MRLRTRAEQDCCGERHAVNRRQNLTSQIHCNSQNPIANQQKPCAASVESGPGLLFHTQNCEVVGKFDALTITMSSPAEMWPEVSGVNVTGMKTSQALGNAIGKEYGP